MAQPIVNSSNVNNSRSTLTPYSPRQPSRTFTATPSPPSVAMQSPNQVPPHMTPHIVRSNSIKSIPSSGPITRSPQQPPLPQPQNNNFYYGQNSRTTRNGSHFYGSTPSPPEPQVPSYPPPAAHPPPLPANWNNHYMQQQQQQPQQPTNQYHQQQYSSFYYNNNSNNNNNNNNGNNKWCMPSNKYYNHNASQSTLMIYNTNATVGVQFPFIPPPPPPPDFTGDDDKDTKDGKKSEWKQIAQSEEDSPSLSSSNSCLTDITDGDYDDLKLTPIRMEPKHGDKDRLIGFLQKLPALGSVDTDSRIERTETENTLISRLSSFSNLRKPDTETMQTNVAVPVMEEETMDVPHALSSPEIEIYDEEEWNPLEEDDENEAQNEGVAPGVVNNKKSCSAPWETSDDETAVDDTPNGSPPKNSDLLGQKKLSITIKDPAVLLKTALNESREGEEEEDEEEEEEEDDLDSLLIHEDRPLHEAPEEVKVREKSVEEEKFDYDEYLKKKEIEQYEQYIKKHNKKKKKKKKKGKSSKKQHLQQHKSPIYIEESMCYDLWDLHEIHEMAMEQARIEEEEERERELERLREEEEMYAVHSPNGRKKKKKKKKSKEKKKLFKKKDKKKVMSPRERKKQKEAMNLSKTGFRIRANRRYRLDDGRIGVCKFRGRTAFGKAGEDWIGIMVEHGDGEHNGTVDGKRYFSCKHGKGIMVRPQTIVEDLGLSHNELDAKTIYNTKSVNHLLLYRQPSATSMYD